jgi:hypothetical protein
MAVGRSKPVASTSFWNELVLATFTLTGADGLVLPEVSEARAVRVWAPLGAVRVSQASAYGATVSSAPVAVPSTRNWTPATATLSLASAVTLTMPLTCAVLAGAVIETVGGVVSEEPPAALKATSCITQLPPPALIGAVAL